jgi:hypothetical protein
MMDFQITMMLLVNSSSYHNINADCGCPACQLAKATVVM